MSGGVDALVPYHDESGHIIAQKEERYFNLYSEKISLSNGGTTDQCLYMESIAIDCNPL